MFIDVLKCNFLVPARLRELSGTMGVEPDKMELLNISVREREVRMCPAVLRERP
jgi:hypothetical protein